MKQSLQLKLSQHLTLTPQLQQSIKLLQLSTVELNQEIERYLLENPMLEREDPDEDPLSGGLPEWTLAPAPESPRDSGLERTESIDADSNLDDIDDGAWGFENNGSQSYGEDEREDPQLPSAEASLQDHLLSQLALLPLSESDKRWIVLIIAHLDDDGYLAASLEDLAETVRDESPHAIEELQIALKHVQQMDPAGVGARDLRECLLLQLAPMPGSTPGLATAREIVRHHIDALATRDLARIKRMVRCDDLELRRGRDLIISLDPKPGRRHSAADIRYVVPDVIVKRVRGKWQVSLNREVMPRIRVNQYYARLLQQSRTTDGKNLSGQLQEARWLVKNIQQRFDTILRVSQAIVEQQRHFFDHGEVAMRPLVLREIAERVELHESTISRVTTQKFMMTPRGVFELKYFFGSSLATDEGGACSSTAIRALIKQFVQAEDTKKPLSDHRISDLLAAQGIVVARRTVAKYREAMHIQPASLRRAI